MGEHARTSAGLPESNPIFPFRAEFLHGLGGVVAHEHARTDAEVLAVMISVREYSDNEVLAIARFLIADAPAARPASLERTLSMELAPLRAPPAGHHGEPQAAPGREGGPSPDQQGDLGGDIRCSGNRA